MKMHLLDQILGDKHEQEAILKQKSQELFFYEFLSFVKGVLELREQGIELLLEVRSSKTCESGETTIFNSKHIYIRYKPEYEMTEQDRAYCAREGTINILSLFSNYKAFGIEENDVNKFYTLRIMNIDGILSESYPKMTSDMCKDNTRDLDESLDWLDLMLFALDKEEEIAPLRYLLMNHAVLQKESPMTAKKSKL